MYSSLIIVSMAAGLGIGVLCWKFTEPWRVAARPGLTDGNRRSANVDMIAGFVSIGVGFAGGFAVEFLLLWLG